MRGYLQLLAVLVAASLTASPARATSVYEYAKGEYVVIDGGIAPNKQLSLAAHGAGEFGSDDFHLYLMDEPVHRKVSVLDGITNNLDSGPTAFHAEWAPDSRHVAIAYRIERHVTINLLYRIERGRAIGIAGTSLFKEVTSRDINNASDNENSSFTGVTWLSPRRFVLKENRLFIGAPASLLHSLGRFGKREIDPFDGKRVFFRFSAEAVCELEGDSRYHVVDLKPGAFED
jgi:hypothetical protein